MKKIVTTLTLTLFSLVVVLTAASCNKDETCRVKINIVDSLGFEQKYKWVVLDIPENAPPSQNGSPNTDNLPVTLNTGVDGFVQAEFELPMIIQANVFDSADFALVNVLKKKIIKLEPGETIEETIPIN